MFSKWGLTHLSENRICAGEGGNNMCCRSEPYHLTFTLDWYRGVIIDQVLITVAFIKKCYWDLRRSGAYLSLLMSQQPCDLSCCGGRKEDRGGQSLGSPSQHGDCSLQGGYEEDGAWLFVMVYGGRMRHNGNKFKQEFYWLYTKKNVFMMRTVKYRNRLPTEVVQSVFLEMW